MSAISLANEDGYLFAALFFLKSSQGYEPLRVNPFSNRVQCACFDCTSSFSPVSSTALFSATVCVSVCIFIVCCILACSYAYSVYEPQRRHLPCGSTSYCPRQHLLLMKWWYGSMNLHRPKYHSWKTTRSEVNQKLGAPFSTLLEHSRLLLPKLSGLPHPIVRHPCPQTARCRATGARSSA
jgi:hypothetical protein